MPSTIGRSPVMAAPTPMPRKPFSAAATAAAQRAGAGVGARRDKLAAPDAPLLPNHVPERAPQLRAAAPAVLLAPGGPRRRPRTANGGVQQPHVAVLLVQAVGHLVGATIVAHVLACRAEARVQGWAHAAAQHRRRRGGARALPAHPCRRMLGRRLRRHQQGPRSLAGRRQPTIAQPCCFPSPPMRQTVASRSISSSSASRRASHIIISLFCCADTATPRRAARTAAGRGVSCVLIGGAAGAPGGR